MIDVIIWGCGGHGREVCLICELAGVRVIGFLDERPEMKGQVVDGIPVLGDIGDVPPAFRGRCEILCAGVADPSVKKRFVAKTRQAGFPIADTLVHPSVHIPKGNTLGKGCIVSAGATLTLNTTLGDFVIINRNVVVGHDAVIEDYATIAPMVVVGGHSTIGEGTFIGMGSSIREKITIGSWSCIGGGAFVKDSVPSNVLYAGVPARFKKNLA
ncbi:acetyltransferase [Salinithrix halophila]|uniref:Acetyltransferase n=1 Tax=Salinithrix halophila TaxID=1485204 RepID=A0ABV8JGZ4_9BACL